MLNSLVLIGRLTKDPELRYTPTGKAVTVGRLAVDRGTMTTQGDKETDFIDIVIWEKQAENVANYKRQGDLLAVRGRLQIRQYTDAEGRRREKAEVVAAEVRFLDNRQAERERGGKNNPGQPATPDPEAGSDTSWQE